MSTPLPAVGADGSISLIGMGLSSVPRLPPSVRVLDLTSNAVRSLEEAAKLPALRELILDRNGVDERALDEGLRGRVMRGVDTLWLNNNECSRIEDTMDVLCRAFPALTYLSMLRNPACPNLYFSDGEAEAYMRYRLYVIHRMPGLELLDSTPVTEEEADEARRVGKFLRVARPDAAAEEQRRPRGKGKKAGAGSTADAVAPAKEEPLAKPAAFLARAPRRYDGTHSEGNRFITDSEL